VVHPHGRGEKVRDEPTWNALGGSPPRAWGKDRPLLDAAQLPRFTPTGVGKRAGSPPLHLPGQVHPHGRGEKPRTGERKRKDEGSPPRAWGKGGLPAKLDPLPRFTPTGVGKRCARAYTPARARVHPHGRGEKETPARSTRESDGSPPRAWGKAQGESCTGLPARFTPTGVGKRCRARVRRPSQAVHPHGRGEKYLPSLCSTRQTGSPPRAWGKGPCAVRTWTCARFTPTGVGKRRRLEIRPLQRQVHPHGRGEKDPAVSVTSTSVGSPPRAWGKVRTSQQTYALSGSPPRAWGKDQEDEIMSENSRFTPTGVGKRPGGRDHE